MSLDSGVLLNTKTLFAFRDILSGISEENGPMSTDRVWEGLFSDTESSLNDVNVGDEAFLRAGEIQEKSRDIICVLKNLTQSLEDRAGALEKRASGALLRIRSNRLPDELLLMILEYASTTFDEALKLSHLCSRFRSVMLPCPRIWNRVVETSRNDQQINTILARSGTLPLKVKVSTYSCFDDKILTEIERSNFENILSQSARITELDFPAMSKGRANQILDLFPSVQLSALRKLSISYSLHDDVFPHFYASWTFPNLNEIRVTNFVPRPILATNITHCNLKFNTHFDLFAVAEFLGSTSSLQNLTLVLVYIEFTGLGQSFVREPLVTNTSVVSLELHIIDELIIIPWITNCIRLSNLTDMSMTFSGNVTLPFLFDVPMVKNIGINVADEIGYLSLGAILRYAPQSLITFSLTAPDHDIRLNWNDDDDDRRPVVPQLRTLHFIRCTYIDFNFLMDVCKLLEEEGVRIERVDVTACRKVTKGALQKAFPFSKVTWTP